MTRINLVPPEELADQHLFAEFREIKMVAKSLARSIFSFKKKYGDDWKTHLLNKIPSTFTLNTGHVTFFYDKGAFLAKRYKLLCKELDKRGVNYTKGGSHDSDEIFLINGLNGEYEPKAVEIEISKIRIYNRIMEKPHWYKYYGQPYTERRPN